MKVETKDYNGDCRRNGNKLRLSGSDWFRVGRWIAISIFIVATAWATLNTNVNALCKDVEASKIADKRQDDAIISIQSDIEYIRKDGEEIKIEQKNINNKIEEGNKLLYKILGKLEQDEVY